MSNNCIDTIVETHNIYCTEFKLTRRKSENNKLSIQFLSLKFPENAALAYTVNMITFHKLCQVIISKLNLSYCILHYFSFIITHTEVKTLQYTKNCTCNIK